MNESVIRPAEELSVSNSSDIERKDQAPSLQSHVIGIDSGKWALWRWVCLRGAGFPVAQMVKLSNPAAAVGADRILRAETLEREAKTEALSSLRRELEAAGPQERSRVLKMMGRVRNGKRIKLLDSAHATDSLKALGAAWERVDSAWISFREVFRATSAQVSQTIREVASGDDFREAVLWQNRQALHSGIDALLKTPAGQASGGSRRRRREEVVARYLQRYCTKNDTIGFFGPVGWARLMPEGEAIVVRPGSGLLAARNVYFEVWCIEAVTEALAKNKELQSWTSPRLMSYLTLAGTSLLSPARAPLRLSAEQAAVLHACDGELSAKEIAGSLLLRNPYLRFKNETEIFELLEQLRQSGFIAWKLEVPIELYPERSLRHILERIDDKTLRSSTLAILAEIEKARTEVECAVGDTDRLDQAIGNLEATFTRLTGTASTRSAGEMYACRTLVYEDCRRDIEIEIGPKVIAALGDPLSLLLTSVRWLTFHIAALNKRLFLETYSEIAKRSNARTIDFATFWYRIYPSIFGDKKRPVDEVLPALQERWAKILALPTGVRRVNYSCEELRSRVLTAFDAPSSGWRSAIYHSPDVMIAASSVADIQRGDFRFVLGELHICMNTLSPAVFSAQHGTPGDLVHYYELDHAESRAVPLIPKAYWPTKSARALPTLSSSADYHIEFAPDAHTVPRDKVLPFGTLVVEKEGDELIARTRDGRLRVDILDIFSDAPTLAIANGFKILPAGNYQPRITLDRLVVCRESWTFTPAELQFAFEKADPDRFVAARRWAQGVGIPRYAFVKSSNETKPLFVDFDSPLYVDLLATTVRRSKDDVSGNPQITLSEMLPTVEQAWLPDANGQHYTSELRMVVVDPPNRQDSVMPKQRSPQRPSRL